VRIGVNGRFYGARITGVQRVARELSARLYDATEATLFLPRGVRASVPSHVRTVRGLLAGQAWEQLELPLRAHSARCDVMLQLSGPAPLLSRGHVMMVYDVLPLTHPHWFAPRFVAWYRFALTRAVHRAAMVLTESEWAKQELMRCLQVPDGKIRIITQGLEPFNRPAMAEAVEYVRAKWSLPEDYLLATGGGDPRKNVEFLNKVLSEWPDEETPAPHLVVVGENAANIHPAQSSSAVHPRVQYIGHVTDEELHALYTGAQVFCFPSLAEGFGRPPLEALGCGTPSVVSTYDAALEVLGEAAVILPLNVDLWVSALARLLGDVEVRTQLVEQGRRIALRYRWQTSAEQVLDACAEVAQHAAADLPKPAVS
jgi:glycosyltransferase involved in cell wall biosynthesis